MPKTLYGKLILFLTLLIGSIGVLYVFINLAITRNYLGHLQQELYRDIARNIVAERNLIKHGRLNKKSLKETFNLYMSINPSIEIYLLDLEGKIVAYSAPAEKIKHNHISLEPIRRFLHEKDPFPLLGDDPRSEKKQKPFSVTSVPSEEAPEGYLYVVLRGDRYDVVEGALWGSYFLKLSGGAMAVSLVIGLIAGLIFIYYLTDRLRGLTALMREFEESSFTNIIQYSEGNETPSDEIDILGNSFDRIAAEIRRQIAAYSEREELRRRLISQLSHDLRSPLASAQGCLESLQIKKDDMPDQQKTEFLEISLKQLKQLEKLVKLFEFSFFDVEENALEPEPFAVDELISDVLQKHVTIAEREGKEIFLSIPKTMPFVFADIGSIERVLDSVVDNAISFSPIGGRIDIGARVENNFVTVEVEDDGSGIATNDLPHIFEPFFTNSVPSRSGRHAGLGLAIAKRLMDLQGGHIEARNNPDRNGVIIAFAIPLHRE